MTRSIEAEKLGIVYDQRCRAASLKIANGYVDNIIDEKKRDEQHIKSLSSFSLKDGNIIDKAGNIIDEKKRDEEYIKSLPSFSLKADSVKVMQDWIETIK